MRSYKYHASGKRAQVDLIFNWAMWRIGILLIIAATLYFVMSSLLSSNLSSHQIENLILVNRLTNSPGLLVHIDPLTNRVYPGVIDKGKFDTAKLEAAFFNNDKRIAVNMELTDLDTGNVMRAYVNEARAKIWDDYVVIGGYDASSVKRYVQIYDNGIFHRGILKIKVLVKQ